MVLLARPLADGDYDQHAALVVGTGLMGHDLPGAEAACSAAGRADIADQFGVPWLDALRVLVIDFQVPRDPQREFIGPGQRDSLK